MAAKAKGNLEFIISGDEKELIRALAKAERRVKQLETGTAKAGRTAKRTGRSMKSAFSTENVKGFVGALTGVAGTMGAIAASVRLVRAELTLIREMQKAAADVQITAHTARLDIIRNMPGPDTEAHRAEISRALAAAKEIAAKSRIPERFASSAMAQALSASGGDVDASKAAVGQSAKFLADRPEAIPQFAGALLDLAKVTGTTDAAVNMGLLTFAAGKSRIVNPQQQALSIPRALLGMSEFGATPAGGVALLSAISRSAGDFMGRTSATGGIALSEALEKFLPGDELTTRDRIERLWDKPSLAKRFWKGASFEKTVKGPIRSLLMDPESEAAQIYRDTLASMPSLDVMAEQAQAQIRNFKLDPLYPTAAAKRTYASTEEQILLSDIVGAEGAVNREGLRNVLKASGVGALDTWLRMGGFEVGTGVGKHMASANAAQILQTRLDELEHPMVKVPMRAGPGREMVSVEAIDRLPTPREAELAAILRRMIEELQRLAPEPAIAPGAPGSAESVEKVLLEIRDDARQRARTESGGSWDYIDPAALN